MVSANGEKSWWMESRYKTKENRDGTQVHEPKASRHALQRMRQRAIPPGIVELIKDFGQSWDAGDGATSHALTKQSFRDIKRSYGRAVAEALASYRNVYLIADGVHVITAARTHRPHFD